MLIRKQRNAFYEVLQVHNITPTELEEKREEDSYELKTFIDDEEYFFYLEKGISAYEVSMRPGFHGIACETYPTSWEGVVDTFDTWAKNLKNELDTPDLWAEAAKTARLFAAAAEPSDDKFNRTELAEVQGQLRLLQLSFTHAALPEAAKQQLIELTETAAVKAEGLTKKDWQNWIIGGFISAITGLALNPTQAGEVLKLVKSAFGGLFLH
jgi:hypothetical protein